MALYSQPSTIFSQAQHGQLDQGLSQATVLQSDDLSQTWRKHMAQAALSDSVNQTTRNQT